LTKVGLVQLGCPKNYVDGEEILGALMAGRPESCQIVADAADADILIVNTCAFIESAKQESIDAILDAVRLKERGQVGRVVVTGCLAQRYGEELAREIPEVDAFLGIESGSQIGNVVFGAPRASGESLISLSSLDVRYPLVPNPRMRAGLKPWTAYLKVSEGCDHQCTFCSIPSFRGRHRSKPIERLVREARDLVELGAREIILIAQDTTAYGMDLYRELALPALLDKLCDIPGLHWIRLLYCYPTMVTAPLIETIAAQPKVLPYIDMPLQHADDEVLRAMKRGGSRDQYLRLFDRLRSAIPGLTLRTTFIVGFPGETDASFDNLAAFVEEVGFDRVGVFEFSPEENTPAGAMSDGIVPKSVARERRRALMASQSRISEAINQSFVGRSLEILIEDGAPGGEWIGRSYRDAPEIDGTVIVESAEPTKPGEFVHVQVSSALAHDLRAHAVELIPV
jgi:ribosomal protein S12 methylthiotransferase